MLQLIDDYVYQATGWRSDLRLLELADAGTLRVTKFARDTVLWHFGMEELVVAALEMGNNGRAACQGDRAIFKQYQSLEYYLGKNL